MLLDIGELPLVIRLRNRTRHLVTVELNTRETIHLAPDEVSRGIEAYEAKDNLQLQKLVASHEIDSVEVDSEDETSASAVAVKTKRPGARAKA